MIQEVKVTTYITSAMRVTMPRVKCIASYMRSYHDQHCNSSIQETVCLSLKQGRLINTGSASFEAEVPFQMVSLSLASS